MIIQEIPTGRFSLVTASDTVPLTYVNASVTGDPSTPLTITRCKYLWVGGAGNIAVKNDKGTSVTVTAVPAGTLLPIQTDFVLATGTTATAIVAFF